MTPRLRLLLLALSPLSLLAQFDAGRIVPADQNIRWLAFGDFGTGEPSQKALAAAMRRRHTEAPFNFAITMGDNFYRCGVRGVKDPKWKTRYEDLYSPMGIPFFATLGNHDYGHPAMICPMSGGSAAAEVEYTKYSQTWKMPARYYTFVAGPVRFIALDTEAWGPAQLEWVKKTLAASENEAGVRWRIVYGHHPIYTSGAHINQPRIARLREQLLPVLMAARVDIYICGHDHDLEHLSSEGMDFLICGGGGAELRKFVSKGPKSLFAESGYGFLDLSADPNRITAQFLDASLTPLDRNPMQRVRTAGR